MGRKDHHRQDGFDGVRVCGLGVGIFLVFAAAAAIAETLSGIIRSENMSSLAYIDGSLSSMLTVSGLNIALIGRIYRPMYQLEGESLSAGQQKTLRRLRQNVLLLKFANRISVLAAVFLSFTGTAENILTGERNGYVYNAVLLNIQLAVFSVLLYGNVTIRFRDENKSWVRSLLDSPRGSTAAKGLRILYVLTFIWCMSFAGGTHTGNMAYMCTAALCVPVMAAVAAMSVKKKDNNKKKEMGGERS